MKIVKFCLPNNKEKFLEGFLIGKKCYRGQIIYEIEWFEDGRYNYTVLPRNKFTVVKEVKNYIPKRLFDRFRISLKEYYKEKTMDIIKGKLKKKSKGK